VLQHLAKENARFRRQSEASAHRQSLAPPAPPPGQAPRNDSSPTSQSSYHSAGYSTWYGRAETVMDYATAKQSFSSMDDASETTTHPSSAYLADAPMPALPPPYAAVASTSATTAAEAMAAFEATVASPTNALRPAGVAPPAAAGQTPFRADRRRSTKPISVLVQVGDGSEESLVHTSSDDGTSYGLRAVPHAADLHSVPESGDSQRLLSGGEPGRRATMESLDNVLEYYRTSPTTADAQGHGSAAAASTTDGDSAADGDRWPSPANLPLHYRMGHGSSLGSMYQTQSSPLAQRTSMSSPIARRADAALWPPEHDDVVASPLGSGSQAQGVDSGFWPAPHQASTATAHGDIFSMLDQLSEPDDLELPPTTASVDYVRADTPDVAAASARPQLAADGDGARGRSDSVLQMESLDGVCGLSDLVDLSSSPGSEFGGYAESNDSTDSFGEPIEQETGMLPR
ncbi:hypothetical protein IWQ56_005936, partial [Coemansia nantahalensis]